MNAICPTCKNEFKLSSEQKYRLKNGTQKSACCSKKCSTAFLTKYPKFKTNCASCGKEFEAKVNRKTRYCSWKCFDNARTKHQLPEHWKCYLKEAKAILKGKGWQGKNRCVKLVGDR